MAVLAFGGSPAGAERRGEALIRMTRLTPPVVRDSFTPLPCTGTPSARTTLQAEGCAEQRIVGLDAQINAVSRNIFALLADDAARRRFIAAQRGWLAYRHSDCLSRSDLFEGGTLAGVIYAQCAADRNAERLRELRAFQSDLRGRG
jgi:uncharacterized protein YecT (DUF1311 family)